MSRRPYLKQGEYQQQAGAASPRIAGARAAMPGGFTGAGGMAAPGQRVAGALLDAGATVLELGAREYARSASRAAESAAFEVEREFELWKMDWKRQNQGLDAAEAQRVFTDKYEELANKRIKEFGHEHEQAGLELRRNLAGRGLFALRDGGLWQEQQIKAWDQSHWKARVWELMKRIDDDPADSVPIEFERGRLIALASQMNPGLDVRGIISELDQQIVNRRFSALLQNDDSLDGAEKLLAELESQNRGQDLKGAGKPYGLEAGQKGAQAAGEASGETGENLAGAAEEQASGQTLAEAGAKAETGKAGPAKGRISQLSPDVRKMIDQAASENNLDPDLVACVVYQESGGNQNDVSKAGAIGLMQLMPGTARELGVNPHDPAQNIQGGVRYLASLLKKYGDINKALAAYNWGPGNYDAWLKTGKGLNGQPMPRETREYASRVLSHKPGMRGKITQNLMAGVVAAENPRPGIPDAETAYIRPRVAPEILRHMRSQLAARQKEAMQNQAYQTVSGWFEQAQDLTGPARTSFIYQKLTQVQDQRQRQQLAAIAHRELIIQKRSQDAQDALSAQDWIGAQKEKGASRMDLFSRLPTSGLGQGARKRVIDVLEGPAKNRTRANEDALHQALAAIDMNGDLQSREERLAYAFEFCLTNAQTDELLNYRGNLSDLTITQVADMAAKLGYTDQVTPLFYRQVQELLPPGRKAARAEIEKAVATVITDGATSQGAKMDYSEAAARGLTHDWLPNVSPGEELELDMFLHEQDIPVSIRNRKLAKREKMGLHVAKSAYESRKELEENRTTWLLSHDEIEDMGEF